MRKAYGTYWNRIIERWGPRRLDEPKPIDIEAFAAEIRANAKVRANSRGGRSAAEHCVAAFRCLYKRAVADELITADRDPAARVAKPRRAPTNRRALSDSRLEDIYEAAASSGDDPELDSLIVRLHVETACRRGGALALRPEDLDTEQCLTQLHEKGGTSRWQPVSPTLMSYLLGHGQRRGATPGTPLLRYRDGRALTYRRYDGLFHRLRRQLPWAASINLSAHWLRHTTLTWVERNYGEAVSRRYAGHAETGSSDAGTIAIYTKAELEEVAAALAMLTQEPHPLAPPHT
ncbi:tyrosine-type recombinase/integrase [Actinoplanes sp. RD1]|uniref:tyrosine-type recombinase/integrase n=1 Tax=Actinoplanes sp. RD1 TaxID=3064538 RepID=UPI0027417AF5|nr:site-specific integrase [Actinoplanes sp. RD1]